MNCPGCGKRMNHHADKEDYRGAGEPVDAELGGVLMEVHACPGCGTIETRTSAWRIGIAVE